jgi:hypothetical protein
MYCILLAVMGSYGQSLWAVMGNHGQLWPVMGNHGQFACAGQSIVAPYANRSIVLQQALPKASSGVTWHCFAPQHLLWLICHGWSVYGCHHCTALSKCKYLHSMFEQVSGLYSFMPMHMFHAG